MMSDSFSVARGFLLGGAALTLLGFALWFLLPLPSAYPPFLPTAVLCFVYGLFCCLKRDGPRGAGKRERHD